jgi:hypothetical protein
MNKLVDNLFQLWIKVGRLDHEMGADIPTKLWNSIMKSTSIYSFQPILDKTAKYKFNETRDV